MRCSSCLGRGRSSRGQADQLPDSSPHSQDCQGAPEEGQLRIGSGVDTQEETWEVVN